MAVAWSHARGGRAPEVVPLSWRRTRAGRADRQLAQPRPAGRPPDRRAGHLLPVVGARPLRPGVTHLHRRCRPARGVALTSSPSPSLASRGSTSARYFHGSTPAILHIASTVWVVGAKGTVKLSADPGQRPRVDHEPRLKALSGTFLQQPDTCQPTDSPSTACSPDLIRRHTSR